MDGIKKAIITHKIQTVQESKNYCDKRSLKKKGTFDKTLDFYSPYCELSEPILETRGLFLDGQDNERQGLRTTKRCEKCGSLFELTVFKEWAYPRPETAEELWASVGVKLKG